MVRSDYLTCIFNQKEFQWNLRLASKILKEIKFDAFAVTGNSGTIFGGALAARMKKNLILVRKPNEQSHCCYGIEGVLEGRYIFLDDFRSSGYTEEMVVEQIQIKLKKPIQVGCYFYKPVILELFGPDSKNPPKHPILGKAERYAIVRPFGPRWQFCLPKS